MPGNEVLLRQNHRALRQINFSMNHIKALHDNISAVPAHTIHADFKTVTAPQDEPVAPVSQESERGQRHRLVQKLQVHLLTDGLATLNGMFTVAEIVLPAPDNEAKDDEKQD